MPSTTLLAALAPTGPLGVLLAHQGGWDEMLMVAVPVAVFAVLLWVANRRAATMGEPEEHEGPRDI